MTIPIRQERMNFRVSTEDKTLLRTAAELLGQDMTDFVLSKARQAAQEIIEDQRDFILPDDQYTAFLAALDRAPVEKPRLRRLLEEPSILESESEQDVAIAG